MMEFNCSEHDMNIYIYIICIDAGNWMRPKFKHMRVDTFNLSSQLRDAALEEASEGCRPSLPNGGGTGGVTPRLPNGQGDQDPTTIPKPKPPRVPKEKTPEQKLQQVIWTNQSYMLHEVKLVNLLLLLFPCFWCLSGAQGEQHCKSPLDRVQAAQFGSQELPFRVAWHKLT